ncbi:MAG: PorT family protein [Treponema sp.]|jgi:hypothetical protein|nr:PorT family protein [Treponema sp.]
MIKAAMKQKIIFLAFLFSLSVSLFAHEKGDIVLNPEFQGGFVFPLIVPDFDAMGIDGNDAGSVGFDYAARVTGNYFFAPDFSANIGFGIGGLMAFSGYDYDNAGAEVKINNTYRTTWITVPFGVRYTKGTFVIGGGFAANTPFDSFHEGKNDQTNTTSNDDDFKTNPFLSWYLDLGLDLAAGEGKSSGFGIALRVGSSFSDIAGNTSAQTFSNFGYAHVSLLLNYMFKVGNFGGKTM